MGINDSQFPEKLSPGSQGGPGFDTQFADGDTGIEQRFSRWQDGLSALQFAVSKATRDEQEAADLLSFFLVMRGGGTGFRYRDETDWTTNPNGVEPPLLVDPAHRSLMEPLGSDHYQLRKAYVGPGGRTVYRKITRPIKPGSVHFFMVIYANGGFAHANGVTIGPEITVDYDTGIVYAPSRGFSVLEAAFSFEVPAHFAEQSDRQLRQQWGAAGMFDIEVAVEEIVGDYGAAHEEHLYGGSSDVAMATRVQDLRLDDGLYQTIVGNPGGGTLRIRPPNDSNFAEPLALGGPYFLIQNQTGQSLFVDGPSGSSLLGLISAGDYGELWKMKNPGTSLEGWILR